MQKIKNFLFTYLKHLLLPLLVIIFYAVFHYANNVSMLTLSILGTLLLIFLAGLLVVYTGYFLVYRHEPGKAGLATVILLVFFLTYGLVFDGLLKTDLVRMEHYLLLPLYLLIGIFITLAIGRLKTKAVNTVNLFTTLILGALILINLVKIVPVEINKTKLTASRVTAAPAQTGEISGTNYPDIYFLIFDAAAGFEVVRDYFNYPQIDEYVNWLKGKGFYVAESSYVNYPHTLYSISSRMNYKEYPFDADELVYYEAITQNRVMADLKEKGYTTIIMGELGRTLGFYSMPDIVADYTLLPDDSNYKAVFNAFGDFMTMVFNPTLARPFISNENVDLESPVYQRHQQMVYFSIDKIGNLQDIQSPKFLYMHLMFPHGPYLFDKDGNFNPLEYIKNNDYYFGQYLFFTKVSMAMIENILEKSDIANPPVIILQSDHGPRPTGGGSIKPLENFPEEYSQLILNAILLPPKCGEAQLSQDMAPINTFPIVFNCLFDSDIPLQ